MGRLTKWCDDCEKVVILTEDGYCYGCGKHSDNMKFTSTDKDIILI